MNIWFELESELVFLVFWCFGVLGVFAFWCLDYGADWNWDWKRDWD